MTTFPSRFRLFRAFASLGLPLLAWLLLLPMEASGDSRRRTADEQQTVEIPNPREHNPLGRSEIDRGKQLAESTDKVKRAKADAVGRPMPSGAERIHALKPLYVQRHDDKNDGPNSRKADVIYYNYATKETIRVVVDLKNNVTQEVQVVKGVTDQPYFTRAEVETALQLIFNDSYTGIALKNAFQKITGTPLVDVITQLKDAQGGVFIHNPNIPAGAVTKDCGAPENDRCMQLFISINGASYIDMSNVIVNLSKMKVLSIDAGPFPHVHN